MPIVREIVRRWLPMAAAITVLCLLIYAAVQQSHRSGADDPQIQLAEDAVRALERGATAASVLPSAKVEIERGLGPFVIVYDGQGQPIAGSGTLRGHLPVPPQGVFEFVRTNGGNASRGSRSAGCASHPSCAGRQRLPQDSCSRAGRCAKSRDGRPTSCACARSHSSPRWAGRCSWRHSPNGCSVSEPRASGRAARATRIA